MPAISDVFVENTIANATATTTVEPVKSLPYNCHTIIIYNPDGANDVFFKIGEADALNPIATADRGIVPSQESITIGMGTASMRPSGDNKIVFSTSAGNIVVYITFVCGNRI